MSLTHRILMYTGQWAKRGYQLSNMSETTYTVSWHTSTSFHPHHQFKSIPSRREHSSTVLYATL